MGQWPSHDELLGAVRSAGWLLEHHATRILNEAGMHPRLGWAYADLDQPAVSRELDVWSYRSLLRHEGAKIDVSAVFLVECKQSELPYVGIGRELPDWRFKYNDQHVLPRNRISKPGERPNTTVSVPAWGELGLDALAAQCGDSNFRVTQLTRLDRKSKGWEANNAGIFTSLVYPLAKALRASQNSRSRPTLGDGSLPRTGWVGITLHFPVVLTSSPLFVVDATEADPLVRQARWTTARRELKSANVTGDFDIDVVTQDAFAEYVSDRLRFAQAVADMLDADPLRFTGETSLPQ